MVPSIITLFCLTERTQTQEKGRVVTYRPEQTRAPAMPAPPPSSPFRLNLGQQRKRAKDLRRALIKMDADALARFRRHHPKCNGMSDIDACNAFERLSDAQLVVARELGLSSWPKLKAHILAMQRARDAIESSSAPDRGSSTLHIRCGSDIKTTLRDAGFAGDFLEYSDPFCQGPVVDREDWLDLRASFLAEAYGSVMGLTAGEILDKRIQAEADLQSAVAKYERIVLWFEHDSYDQLVLARCLSQFAATPPRRLELVAVNNYPGSSRFIGLGQLPPEALWLLWNTRQPVSPQQLLLGQSVWTLLRSADPTPLASIANAGTPELPDLAPALRRHCQELPWVEDGLSLTERLILQLLSEQPRTVSDIFNALMLGFEPLPWLGDIMLLRIVENMRRVSEPVFTGTFEGKDRRWPRELLTITPTGQAVLAGDRDWLSLQPPERWVGGVHIPSASACWRWDTIGPTIVLRHGNERF